MLKQFLLINKEKLSGKMNKGQEQTGNEESL